MRKENRRTFLTAGVAGLVLAGRARGAHAVRLGGPVFLKSEDPEELAREHQRLGYTGAYCPAAKVEDTERVRAIEKAFKSAGVSIAEVGAWVNMLDPDLEKRRKNLEYVTQRLALADAVGALNCVDIAGSYNKDVWYGPHPKNLSPEFFDATVENCRKLIDAVKPKRTKLTIEMMGWIVPNGPESYLKLIRAVDRPAFAVHMDICNVVNSPERFYDNASFTAECFSKLGRWIQSCHAKDLEWKAEMNMHFVEVIPGRGSLDYTTYLREIAKLPHRPPLMLEHLKTAAEYDEGAAYIRKTGAAAGVLFS
ncbi:MAG: sugar phosphate isomerase/epimerase [Bryobacteraceae bacterium]|nr:sugar phosphate isomerase/epimerase [Bryobacteraceae bacterium]